MPDVANGLPNDVSADWGYPVLVKTRRVADWHDQCEDCEGHNWREVELPESDWFWRPLYLRVEFSPLLRGLESDRSALGRLVGELKREGSL